MVVPDEHGASGSAGAQAYVDALPRDAPVFLEKPASKQPGGAAAAVMRYKLKDLFAGQARSYDARATDYGPLPLDIPIAAARDVDRAAALLRGASRPVLVLGSDAMMCR